MAYLASRAISRASIFGCTRNNRSAFAMMLYVQWRTAPGEASSAPSASASAASSFAAAAAAGSFSAGDIKS